ncbi:MAG: DNA recombination protein RmuC [Rhodospirillales bacterium]|nr:DNA recombination protein RmuC [Rhodospirillales bacterium]
MLTLLSLAAACVAALAALIAMLVVLRQARLLEHLRLAAEQALAGQRAEGETTRAALRGAGADQAERLGALRGALDTAIEQLRTVLSRGQGELRLALNEAQQAADARIAAQFETTRAMLEAKLREMREGNETKLAAIQATVNEQLHAAVEKQMTESFARVVDQFTAVQKAMGDVQAVTAQIGDIKRLFSNVKTRGGWGETQVRAMLDDVLPPGAYHANHKVRADSDEVVEFAVVMPMRGEVRPVLPIDAKFPVEDFERLLAASEAGDVEGERAATRMLERRVRDEARKIAAKYICPPVTVEFAVLYLPTDALYAEVARIPGLIDEIGRECRVLVMGPTLFPALLRTIHLGFVTLALEQKADQVRALLGATKGEMLKMDKVLSQLARQASTFSTTIERARVRTRAVDRKLRGVEAIEDEQAEALLALDSEAERAPDPADLEA